MKPDYTETQGQYLAFIHQYTLIHDIAPAEADMQRFFQVTAPTIHQMILNLEKRGFITRVPYQPRSIRLIILEEELPPLRRPRWRDQKRNS